MGAELVDQSDAPLAVAERDQLLSEQLHANRWAVALRQLRVEQRGYPVAPEQLAHRRAGAGAGQEFIHLLGQHGALIVRAPSRCRYRSCRRMREAWSARACSWSCPRTTGAALAALRAA